MKLWQLKLSLLLLAPPVCAKDLGQWEKTIRLYASGIVT